MKNNNFQTFLRTDLSKTLPGEYIVIIDGKVFKKGKDIERILRQAKEKYPTKTPFVTKMPQRGTLVMSNDSL